MFKVIKGETLDEIALKLNKEINNDRHQPIIHHVQEVNKSLVGGHSIQDFNVLVEL